MPLIVCTSCGTKLNVPETAAGKKVACPKCKAVIAVPAAPSEAITELPPAPPPRPVDDIEGEVEAPRRRPAPAKRGMSVLVILLILGGVGVLGCGCLGILGALFIPALSKARDAAGRVQTMNNIKQLTLGMHGYNDSFKKLPMQRDHEPPPAGPQAELSWRVSLLPFLEQGQLYNRFDRLAGWDDAKNKGLLNPLPMTFTDPQRPPAGDPAATYLQAFAGPDAVIRNAGRPLAINTIRDGTSNTLLLAEASSPTPWSRPVDIEPLAGQPLPLQPGLSVVGFVDGSAAVLDRSQVPDDVLRGFINPDDGKGMERDRYFPPR